MTMPGLPKVPAAEKIDVDENGRDFGSVLMEKNVDKFLEALASSAPTPGGGGAAALCGALGIALGNMVGSLTLGKKKYADVQEDILTLNAKAKRCELILSRSSTPTQRRLRRSRKRMAFRRMTPCAPK